MFTHNQMSSQRKGSTNNTKTPIINHTVQSCSEAIIQRATIHPSSLTKGGILQLQQTIGNQAVVQLFKSLGAMKDESRVTNEEESASLEGQPFKHSTKQIEMEMESSAAIQKKENRTGLPDKLKTGIENLSGMSLDDVRVHYNSSKPSGLQAFAYTQGTDIHLGPGQEKHLPHEAWHVAQQKQGRVKPTLQAKGMPINSDERLEKEADVMGAKAVASLLQYDQIERFTKVSNVLCDNSNPNQYTSEKIIQRKLKVHVATSIDGEEFYEYAADLFDVITFLKGQKCFDDKTGVMFLIEDVSVQKRKLLLKEISTGKLYVYDSAKDEYILYVSEEEKKVEEKRSKEMDISHEPTHMAQSSKTDSVLTSHKTKIKVVVYRTNHHLERHQYHLIGRGNHSTFIGGIQRTKEVVNKAVKQLKDKLNQRDFVGNIKNAKFNENIGELVGYQSDLEGERNGYPTTTHVEGYFNWRSNGEMLEILSAYPGKPYDGPKYTGEIKRQ